MATNVKDQITKELARLRMWRDVANENEAILETEIVHNRINSLLDQLENEQVWNPKVHSQ